jgi:PBSX family phage terminase large subunit
MKIPKLSDKQIKALDILKTQQYNEILFSGGARAGKTFLVLFYFMCCALVYDGIRFLIARLRMNHVKANIWLQDIPKLRQYDLFSHMELDKQNLIIKLDNSQIWLGGLDDKDRTDKILGQEYAGVFLNECVQIPISSRNLILTRLAQNIPGFTNSIIYDCNPRHPSHYIYKEFYIEKNKDRAKLEWSPYDNKDNLPPSYISNTLEKLKGNDRKRFLLGEWAAVPGAVYTVKDSNVIEVNQDLMYYDDVIGGLDFGLYSAFSLWGIKGNNAYCLKELILQGSQQTTTDNIIKELDKIEEVKFYEIIIYCDHEPDRIQMLENAGYYAKKAYKSIEAGDSVVNEFELFFDVNCKNTFQSMLNLVHQQDNNGNFIDGKHVKENDHEADGARYALSGWKIENPGIGHYIKQ